MKRIALKLAHVGINPDSPEEMKKMRFFLHDVLGMEETMETPVSWFGMDGKAELMKQEGRGRKGHLGFYTPDIKQAMECSPPNSCLKRERSLSGINSFPMMVTISVSFL